MVKGFIGFRICPRINPQAWGASVMPNSAKIRVIPPGRRARALGDDLGAVAGTSLDKGVELARWRRRTSQSDQAASSMAMA
jgi:hypothetical protein